MRRLVALLTGAAILLFGLEILLGPSDERARHGADVEAITIDSDAVARELPVQVVTPDGGGEDRPLLVFLHGRDEAGDGELASLHDEFYDALDEAGARAPVVVFPNGETSSYWHNRDDGDWEDYVTQEVIPRAVKETGADSGRVAIGGISMGGFGAYDVARLNPERFCAVGGHSPALWQNGADSAQGAFDDAADFETHDVIGAARTDPAIFGEASIWVDAGRDDPFQSGIQAFTAALDSSGRRYSAHFPPGGHDGEYWKSHWDEYMKFYAESLARC